MIPYGKQSIDDDDIEKVVEVLRSDWLTTGPKISEFEERFAAITGSKYSIAVSSGTAALHTSMFALNIEPGDEVVVPAITFAASANCVVYQGGTPVFVDVDKETLLIDPEQAAGKVNSNTKAIIAVDYTGQACDYDLLLRISREKGIFLVADSCHSLGGKYKGMAIGGLADLTAFSFHPVKHITTGEGGMISTNDSVLAQRMRVFRNHGITTDHRQRERQGSWYYEMVDLGYNYRITDFQCALGISQIGRLQKWVDRRREIARVYDNAFADIEGIEPLKVRPEVLHSYHLYVIRLDEEALGIKRDHIFDALRKKGIGVNVHYIPVHLHPFYRQRFGTHEGQCPIAEKVYREIISLPMYPSLTEADQNYVIDTLKRIIS